MRTSATDTPTVLSVGTYILDILGRPITAVTPLGGLIDEIMLTAAGTAGGTAVDLANLGMNTIAVGAVGDDAAGVFLRQLLTDAGVDTSSMAVVGEAQTSASMLAIQPDGARPAWHVRGANSLFCAEHFPRELLAKADAMHFGALLALPAFDGPAMAELLQEAHSAGLLVTADCLHIRRDDGMALMEQYLPHVDIFTPNDDEALTLTGQPTIIEAARVLKAMGPGAVIVTAGADGVVGIDADGEFSLPAHHVPVIDSTGCGDAFAAGTLTRRLAGYVGLS